MSAARTLTAVLVVAAAAGSTVQAEQDRTGVDTRVVPGVIAQGGIFGDDSPRSRSQIGLTVGVQVRGQTSRRTGLSFEAAFEPRGVANPHFDETLHVLYLQVGAEIGRRTYVRPSGGFALHLWSGSSAETGLGLAPAFGVAVGRRFAAGERVRIGPEFIARYSIAHGAFSWSMGVQLPIGWTAR